MPPLFVSSKGLVSLFALLALYLMPGVAFAQDQPTLQPLAPPPNPGEASGPAAGGGFSNFQNTPVTSILDNYEQFSGKHLIRDANLTGVPPVSINASGVSKAEMLRLIEATLLLNGVAIVSVDANADKVINIAAHNPRNEGVKIYANAADLPHDEEIVSYYMPLSYISPTEAKTVFDNSAPAHQYGFYVPAPSAQALIVTDNVSVIRQLIAMKELIDVPAAPVVSQIVQLNSADAEKVAEILNKLLDQGTGGTAPAPPSPDGGNNVVPARVGNLAPLENEHNLLSGPAKIIPDVRSNSLLIVTRPVNMPFLLKLIGQLDQTDNFLIPKRRPLRYVLAQDILPALEATLAQGKEEQDQIKKDATPNNGNNNQPQTQQQSAASSAGSSGGNGSVNTITPQLQAPTENNVPTVVTIGKTKLLADNRSNCIIVFGSPDVTARVFQMIDELDRKPLQVYLATVIGELSLSNDEEFGIDLLQKYQSIGQGGIASSSFTGAATTASGATVAGTVPNPKTLISNTLFPLVSGLTIYGAIGSTLDAYVRALETTDRFKVISRPSVYTTNNKLAVIANGSQVPVPGNITSGFTGTTSDNSTGLTTTASVTYQNVLLQLDIIPLINANHEVTLKIRQTNDSLGKNNLIGGNEVPTINTQEINTEVTVRDRGTVVIGGLISDKTTRDTTGVPWLSDIPVLGYLFKDTSKTKQRDELIILIQPNVVETDADEDRVNTAEKQRTILGREAAEAATGFSDAPNPHSPLEQTPVPAYLKQASTTSTTTTTVTAKPSGTYNSKTNSSVKSTTTTTTVTTPGGAAPSTHPDVSKGQLPPDAPPMVKP